MNELFLDEIVQPDSRVSNSSRSARRADRAERDRKRRRRRRRNLTALVILLLVLGGGGYAVVQWGLPLFHSLGAGGEEAADDYPGPGATTVEVVIPTGATGADMALILYQADVVASTRAFTRAFAANPDASSIQPGTYGLVFQMRASDAVAALLNPESKVQTRVTIAEGLRFDQILEKLTSVTAVPLADFEAAMADPAAVGLPAEAGGNFEGWLFASTYTFEPGTDPAQMITTMIAKTVAVLDAQGVAPADRMRVLTIASLVERESPDPGVSPMMARAIQNRLDIDMKLDIDASVAYGLNKSGTELTTADLEDPTNPYNTYLHPGLPPGPIASPGEASIDAVLHPADGPWKFWVTINPDTKETLFAETYDEQLANQELLREWQAANGG